MLLYLGLQSLFSPALQLGRLACQHQGELTARRIVREMMPSLAQAAAEDFLVQFGQLTPYRNLAVTQAVLQVLQS